jgi:NADH-quinone oxidoreductase subunit L
MRKMGGVWKKIPITYAFMWIGNLALAGMPFFAGYYSKDMILEATYAAGECISHFAYWMGIVAAFMTAFYSWRLLWLTFHGTPRMDHHTFDHAHEAPKIMWMPLLILAAGAIFAGFLGFPYFVGSKRFDFWGSSVVTAAHDVLDKAHHIPELYEYLPTLVGVVGIALGIFLYSKAKAIPPKIAQALPLFYKLSLNKFYIDELYNCLFVKSAWALGRLFSKGDRNVIDALGPDGAAVLSNQAASRFSRFQTGFIFNYASVMIGGMVLFIAYLLWTYWS